MAAFYIQVYDNIMQEQISFEKLNFESLDEAKQYRDNLRGLYRNAEDRKVRMFLEIYPDKEEEDIEEEFDFDELQEEE